MSKKPNKTVLLIEDNRGDARLLREMFNERGAHDTELTHVECMRDAEEHLAAHAVAIVLLDLGLPDAQGLEAVRRAHAAAPRVPLVVLTGLDDESLAAQALQEGAQDYLIKGQIDARGLVRAMRYATERNRLEGLKDEFVSTVSHELRTPLTSISGSLGLLIGNAAGNLPDPVARLVSIAHTNSQRLVRLVNDILDIEKMEAGQIVFNFGRVDARALVEHAIEANRGLAEAYGVRIRLEDACAVADVRADSDRLAQVVTNLLSNAIKFSPAQDEVVVAIKKGTDFVRISVRDHGPGISVDFKPHIFERFAQADATNARRKGGTGLGLSIVKQIVDRLGGEVGFDDALGGGTIFYVELPCWDLVTGMAIDLDAQLGSPRILLCEDDPDTAVVMRGQLRQIGLATDFAHTAAEALACATATHYRALLIDLLLPDGDGINLILRLREMPEYRDTPIVVVSADPDRGRGDSRSSELNVLDWLDKPVDFDRLRRVLTKPPAREANRRPRILHFNNANIVARALSEIADVVSVHSIEEARRATKAHHFDIAVLEMAPAAGAGVEPMPDFRDSNGNALSVVAFPAQGANSAHSAHPQGAPAVSDPSIARLVATVRDRLASAAASLPEEIV
jgi:signal transduction histidine kinase